MGLDYETWRPMSEKPRHGPTIEITLEFTGEDIPEGWQRLNAGGRMVESGYYHADEGYFLTRNHYLGSYRKMIAWRYKKPVEPFLGDMPGQIVGGDIAVLMDGMIAQFKGAENTSAQAA